VYHGNYFILFNNIYDFAPEDINPGSHKESRRFAAYD